MNQPLIVSLNTRLPFDVIGQALTEALPDARIQPIPAAESWLVTAPPLDTPQQLAARLSHLPVNVEANDPIISALAKAN